jgi:hypothetical protein
LIFFLFQGGRIALFFADGGMTCLQEHGDGVKRCMGDINEFENDVPVNPQISDIKTEEICEKMQKMATCARTELKKCKDTTPENIVSSMLHSSGQTIGCKFAKPKSTSSVSSTSPSEINTLLGWVLTSLAAGGLLF